MKGIFRILIVIGLLGYCLAFQGMRHLWEPDEGRYTAVAMEMLRHGDWLKPQLHPEQPHWTKPPLTYWAIASSISFLGRNEFAARLVSSLSFFFTTCLVYLLGRIFLARKAWLPPLVYASFLLPAAASNIITTDGLLTLWETLALCAYVHATWGENRNSAFTWIMVMWAAFGLAFLTKGPPGLLPLMAIIIHRLWRPRDMNFPKLHWFPGLTIMLAIGMSWYVLVIVLSPDLFHYFVYHEMYGRIITGEHGRNSEWYKAFVVYLPILVLGSLPWTFWLARYGFKNFTILFRGRQATMDQKQRQNLFLLLWILCPLLIFMFSSSRLPLYLLPLFVPLALIASRGLEAAAFSWNRRHRLLVIFWSILLLSLRIIAAKIPSDKDAATVAAAIAATTTSPYYEISFYATEPMLGLNFYLNKDVEYITKDTLQDELEEAENRLWIIRPEAVSQFLAKTASLDRNFRKVGQVADRYLLFQLANFPDPTPPDNL